jgi:hypothetical protein
VSEKFNDAELGKRYRWLKNRTPTDNDKNMRKKSRRNERRKKSIDASSANKLRATRENVPLSDNGTWIDNRIMVPRRRLRQLARLHPSE